MRVSTRLNATSVAVQPGGVKSSKVSVSSCSTLPKPRNSRSAPSQ